MSIQELGNLVRVGVGPVAEEGSSAVVQFRVT
jgi:hypothetical protein